MRFRLRRQRQARAGSRGGVSANLGIGWLAQVRSRRQGALRWGSQTPAIHPVSHIAATSRVAQQNGIRHTSVMWQGASDRDVPSGSSCDQRISWSLTAKRRPSRPKTCRRIADHRRSETVLLTCALHGEAYEVAGAISPVLVDPPGGNVCAATQALVIRPVATIYKIA